MSRPAQPGTVPLAADRAGRPGAPVLLLGGSLGTRREMWAPQLAGLADDFELISFDHRGHGDSPVPPGPYEIAELGEDVLALMDRLGVPHAHYCGLSIGGMVGQWLAAHAPERIASLVLVCTAAHVPNGETFTERAEAVLAAGTPAPLADTVVARWFTRGFAAAEPELVARHRDMIAATPAEGYAGCCAAIAAMDLREQLGSIRAPTLVIGGAQDQSLPPELGREVAETVPGARFELLHPAAHLATVERADAVNQLVREHVTHASGGASCPEHPRERQGMTPSDDAFQAAMRIRREVLGDEHVDRATENATEFTAPFQEFITRVAWGGAWTRDGLDRRTRSVITLSVLTALGRENEIAMHVRGALRNGLTPDEIREVLIHTAIYAGIPAANSAIAIADRVIEAQK